MLESGAIDKLSAYCNDPTKGYTGLKELLQHNSFSVYQLQNALKDAAKNGRTSVVEILLEHGGRDIRNAGPQAIENAAENGHLKVVEILAKETNTKITPENISKLLISTAEKGNATDIERIFGMFTPKLGIVSRIFSRPSADVVEQNKAIRERACIEALGRAAGSENVKVVEKLIDLNPGIVTKEIDGSPLLFNCWYHEDTSVAELLLKQGANPYAKYKDPPSQSSVYDGMSVFDMAAKAGNVKALELLQSKKKPTREDVDSAFIAAAQADTYPGGSIECLKFLEKNNPKPSQEAVDMALTVALSRSRSPDVVKAIREGTPKPSQKAIDEALTKLITSNNLYVSGYELGFVEAIIQSDPKPNIAAALKQLEIANQEFEKSGVARLTATHTASKYSHETENQYTSRVNYLATALAAKRDYYKQFAGLLQMAAPTQQQEVAEVAPAAIAADGQESGEQALVAPQPVAVVDPGVAAQPVTASAVIEGAEPLPPPASSAEDYELFKNAITSGDNKAVIQLINSDRGLLEMVYGDDGDSALHFAAKHGNKEIVLAIIEAMPDLIFSENSKKETPLQMAERLGLEISDDLHPQLPPEDPALAQPPEPDTEVSQNLRPTVVPAEPATGPGTQQPAAEPGTQPAPALAPAAPPVAAPPVAVAAAPVPVAQPAAAVILTQPQKEAAEKLAKEVFAQFEKDSSISDTQLASKFLLQRALEGHKAEIQALEPKPEATQRFYHQIATEIDGSIIGNDRKKYLVQEVLIPHVTADKGLAGKKRILDALGNYDPSKAAENDRLPDLNVNTQAYSDVAPVNNSMVSTILELNEADALDGLKAMRLDPKTFNERLNQIDSATGLTPLSAALRQKQFEVVDFLIANGADLTLKNGRGQGASDTLAYLAEAQQDEITRAEQAVVAAKEGITTATRAALNAAVTAGTISANEARFGLYSRDIVNNDADVITAKGILDHNKQNFDNAKKDASKIESYQNKVKQYEKDVGVTPKEANIQNGVSGVINAVGQGYNNNRYIKNRKGDIEDTYSISDSFIKSFEAAGKSIGATFKKWNERSAGMMVVTFIPTFLVVLPLKAIILGPLSILNAVSNVAANALNATCNLLGSTLNFGFKGVGSLLHAAGDICMKMENYNGFGSTFLKPLAYFAGNLLHTTGTAFDKTGDVCQNAGALAGAAAKLAINTANVIPLVLGKESRQQYGEQLRQNLGSTWKTAVQTAASVVYAGTGTLKEFGQQTFEAGNKFSKDDNSVLRAMSGGAKLVGVACLTGAEVPERFTTSIKCGLQLDRDGFLQGLWATAASAFVGVWEAVKVTPNAATLGLANEVQANTKFIDHGKGKDGIQTTTQTIDFDRIAGVKDATSQIRQGQAATETEYLNSRAAKVEAARAAPPSTGRGT